MALGHREGTAAAEKLAGPSAWALTNHLRACVDNQGLALSGTFVHVFLEVSEGTALAADHSGVPRVR